MKAIALLMAAVGTALAVGAVLEFLYFGPGTPQFWAGVVATPAGLLFAAAGIALWRHGPGARKLVRVAARAMLGATLISAGLGVMGPPAILMGVVAPVAALVAVRRRRPATGSRPA